MILLEHEAKGLLRSAGLPVPDSFLVGSADVVPALPFPLVVKAQIPKGGRGKAGGIRVVDDRAAYDQAVADLLGSELLGCHVGELLIEAKQQSERELYLSVLLDRTAGALVLLARRQGGVEVEQADDGDVLRIPLEDSDMLTDTQLGRLLDYYGLDAGYADELGAVVEGLYALLRDQDALLVEVNPLMVQPGGRLVCADAKVELDDAAAFRHPDWKFSQAGGSSQFVVLDATGQVASMANGAGLAMATVDAIEAAGAKAANFFDVGGGTDVAGMVEALGRIAAIGDVRAIVVNIFGGITRCDQVAEAIIAARGSVDDLPPLFVRLTGTNEAEGLRLLSEADITPLGTLADCVQAAVAEVKGEHDA